MAFTSLLNPGTVSLATQSITSVANGQTLVNYTTSAGQKLAELGQKLGTSGNADKFTGMTPGISLSDQNGTIVATDAGSGQVLGAVGAGKQQSFPPSYIGTDSNSGRTDKFKVTLISTPMLGAPQDNMVVFDVMPTIDESHAASYDTVDVLHHPGKMMKYKGTESRQWRITADLVSRTTQEADTNFKIMNIIRSWVMPFYGTGTASKFPDKLGAPPQIVTLRAYGPRMIGPVSCVVTDYNWVFENDRDYIPTTDKIPFPVHLKVSLSLVETWSPAEFTKFDLDLYRKGVLPAAFGGQISNQVSSASSTTSAKPSSSSQNIGVSSAAPSTIDVSQAQTSPVSVLLGANNSANAVRNSALPPFINVRGGGS